MKMLRFLFESRMSFWFGSTLSISVLWLSHGHWVAFLALLVVSVLVQSAVDYFVFKKQSAVS